MTDKYQIRRGRTEIDIPHNENTTTFVYDKHGPGTYANVANSIEEAGLATPTMAETASLVHQVHEAENEPEFDNIKKLMKDRWLWAFTGTLYVPNKGAYIQDNPEIREGMPYMDESELIKKLEANDSNVRLVPFGFKTGTMTPIQLAKNPYLNALAGEEGADKLGEVADKYKNKPYLWSFDSVNQPTTRVSALNSFGDLVHGWLDVDGGDLGDYWVGYAFGVKNTGEASRTKK